MARWIRWLSIFLLLPSTFAQSRKLSLPFPLEPAHPGGSVSTFEAVPDDGRIVYLAREAADARLELYSRPVDGSQASTRLTGSIPMTERIDHDFQISPDSKRVYFLSLETIYDEYGSVDHARLYGAPIDGASVAKRLADIGGYAQDFSVSPDGTWLVYSMLIIDAYGTDPYRTELFSVPTDGHREPILLSSATRSFNEDFRIADGRVVFVATPSAGAGEELISITLEGTDRIVLGGTQLPFRGVPQFVLAPDRARVVYLADQRTRRVFELFSVPIEGGAATRLNGTLVQNGDVQEFEVSPDSTRVLYRANQELAALPELYVTPIDAASPPLKVSGNRVGYGVTAGARFSSDSTRVIYRADGLHPGIFQLFSAPADASAVPVLVSGASVSGGDVIEYYYQSRPHLFLGAGSTVVYLADAEHNGRNEIFAAPIDGSSPPVKLSGDLVPGGDVLEFELSADGSQVVFRADKEVDQRCDLFAVPVAGGAAQKMNRRFRLPDRPFTFRVTSDGREVFYAGMEGEPGFQELYQRPTDASTPTAVVNGTLSQGNALGYVRTFFEDPASERVIYAADQFVDNDEALVSVRTDGPLEHVQLNDPLEAVNDSISPRGLTQGRLVYIQPAGTDQALFSVPVDRSLPPVELGPALERPFFRQSMRFSLDGSRVLFVAGDSVPGAPPELYGAPVDGSEPPVKLSGTLVLNGGVEESIGLVPDGLRATYFADAERDGITELFSVAIDGSAPPRKLSGMLVEGGEVIAEYTPDPPLVTPDSRLVVYRADALVDGRVELFAAPLDGASPPHRVSGALLPDGDVQAFFALALGGESVVYRADALVDERFELFLAPLDGSTAPVRLGLGLAPRGNVLEFELTPDGARVVLRADTDGDVLVELYVVELRGGRVQRLDAPAGASVLEFRIDPAGRRVVFSADPVRPGGSGLFSAPLDASLPPVRLDFAQHEGSEILYFGISPDGKKVAFLADAYLDLVYELFCAPIDGRNPAVRKNEPLPAGREVRSFQISADSRRAFYVADQDENDVYELYQVLLELPSHSSPRRR